MLIAAWNVNGIRAVLRRGDLQSFLAKFKPDVLCLQETKASPEQVELDLPDYPHRYWNSAEKKGYSGTAIFCKTEPLSSSVDIGVAHHDREGRVTTVEFRDYYVVSVYVPNSKQDLSRLDDRQDWDRCFLDFLNRLQAKKPVVFCGDFNVAHQEIDLARPKQNVGEHGFTDEERAGFRAMLAAAFVDTFRHFYPDKTEAYTWWKQISNARARNVGWRIDYVMVSQPLVPRLKSAAILADVYGSDHCPVTVELS